MSKPTILFFTSQRASHLGNYKSLVEEMGYRTVEIRWPSSNPGESLRRVGRPRMIIIDRYFFSYYDEPAWPIITWLREAYVGSKLPICVVMADALLIRGAFAEEFSAAGASCIWRATDAVHHKREIARQIKRMIREYRELRGN